jgi:hypothetical protein
MMMSLEFSVRIFTHLGNFFASEGLAEPTKFYLTDLQEATNLSALDVMKPTDNLT